MIGDLIAERYGNGQFSHTSILNIESNQTFVYDADLGRKSAIAKSTWNEFILSNKFVKVIRLKHLNTECISNKLTHLLPHYEYSIANNQSDNSTYCSKFVLDTINACGAKLKFDYSNVLPITFFLEIDHENILDTR